jgi:hypothetical protein
LPSACLTRVCRFGLIRVLHRSTHARHRSQFMASPGEYPGPVSGPGKAEILVSDRSAEELAEADVESASRWIEIIADHHEVLSRLSTWRLPTTATDLQTAVGALSSMVNHCRSRGSNNRSGPLGDSLLSPEPAITSFPRQRPGSSELPFSMRTSTTRNT